MEVGSRDGEAEARNVIIFESLLGLAKVFRSPVCEDMLDILLVSIATVLFASLTNLLVSGSVMTCFCKEGSIAFQISDLSD